MTYSVDSGYKELLTNDSKSYEEINRNKGVDHDGTMLPLQLSEQASREVIDGRWRAVALVSICNIQ